MKGLNQNLAAGNLGPKSFFPLRKYPLWLRHKKMEIMAGAHYTLALQDCQKIDLDYILP
jgi:hypothetical protein